MRTLLVKMSSMGDVFHTFPALTDAQQKIPGLVVDWVVEKSFEDIPAWHSVVDQVFAIELRKWRKHPFKYRKEIKHFFSGINQNQYDLVIDAQGLLKSAWVVKKIQSGLRVGLDWSSAREALASLFYQQKLCVDKDQHAILRLRELFAKAFNYSVDTPQINYGLETSGWQELPEVVEHFQDKPYAVLLHGTTWQTKLWPEANWIELIQKLDEVGIKVVLPWGTSEEKQRSERIITQSKISQAWCPDNMLSINQMARLLSKAKWVVSVDTGLSHVAAALNVDELVLYRVTDPQKVGALGEKVDYLVSPCAKQYMKHFRSKQQELQSLEGLSVGEVLTKMGLDDE